MKKFNVNDHVRVKLNNRGLKILVDYYEQLRLPRLNDSFVLLNHKPDEDGYMKFQMWDLMVIFGSHMGIGRELVFDCNIFLEIKDERSTPSKN